MTALGKSLLGAAVGAGVLAMSAMSASASIVCAGSTCWHTHESYSYPPAAHVVIHDDNWHWGPHVTIRDHEGRGYWSGRHWHEW
jgi:hypothetical protein